MGQWNHVDRLDSSRGSVTCRCGAKYEIYKDDGMPGCRDVETVDCEFCGRQLARHFGTCEGTLVDDRDVCGALKAARKEYDDAVRSYIQENGYTWGTDEYAEILRKWHDAVNKIVGKKR